MGASESKLAFKKSIFELASRENIPHTDSLWSSFYTLPDASWAVEDVFSLWSPNDIASLTQPERPSQGLQCDPSKNFETLLYVLVARLRTLQTIPVYPDDQQTNREILNCMRILTRIMPFAYDAPHLREWLDIFLWQERRPVVFHDKEKDRYKVLDGLNPSVEFSMDESSKIIGPPLGETILDLIVKYCFFPGFTIPRRQDEEGNTVRDTSIRVWTSGIGNSRPQGSTKENERHQQETTRLLICFMSQIMYIQPHEVATSDIKPQTYLTTKLPQRSVNGLLCSLLNTVLKYNPSVWNVPAELVALAQENRKHLVINCLHLVLVLTIYEPPANAGQNQFRKALSQLHRPNDFQFIQQGVNQALIHPITSAINNYTFSKEKSIPWAPELISFLWELVQCNRRFRRYLIDTGRILDYVIIILYHAIDSKDDPAKQGVLRMCIYVLQTFSTEDKFAEELNTIFRRPETLPPVMRIANFHGSYMDFLICSIHSIIINAKGGLESRFESLYPPLLASLMNIAPYARNLQRATSTKLMNICGKFIAPGYLLRNDSNNRMLLELLQVLNVIVESHAAENRRLIEVLVANKKRLQALQEFNIDGALAELDRLAQQRKDGGEDVSAFHSPLSSRPTSFDSARSPAHAASARTPSLNDVPENDRFAIGDDEDEEDEESAQVNGDDTPRASSATNPVASRDDASSPRLSEKARGKQPAALSTASTTAASSRSPSTASLSTLNTRPATAIHRTSETPTIASTTTTTFNPTHDWFDGWFPLLLSLLTPLLNVIDLAEKKQIIFRDTALHPNNNHGDVSLTPTQEKQPAERGGEARQPAQHAGFGGSGPGGGGGGGEAQTPRPDGQSPFRTPGLETPAPTPIAGVLARPKESFAWTAIAIGWYTALIWSRIYLSEAEAFQGSGGLYNSSANIALFRRSAQQGQGEISLRSPRGAIDAVGNSLAERVRGLALK